ncbi:carboxymuconolactone decarboxylase family protein [Sinorhizobium medicae]|uniref:Carboxymuconolactone decarboxylase n=1 Tax=Sinorhizobium medicae TaxID=110321 RepID=A0A508X6R6_9HYPH|nr:carboxymuconolactone decarboxylase family protein [Sinorhizobium medicae]VTZ65452.1 Carboxymuconolactone decarboxylase [Sinorhizobium medicae]
MSNDFEESKLADLVSADTTGRADVGLAVLSEVGGRGYAGPVCALAGVSEDLARLTIAFPYGEVLSRPALGLRERQIITVSILLAHGSAQSQLRFHMDGLLNVGGSREDLTGLLYLAAAVLGFPAAINAVPIVRSVLSERDLSAPPASDQAISAPLTGNPKARATLEDISADFVAWQTEIAAGDLLARCALDPRLLHIAAASMLATHAKHPSILIGHFRRALSAGATKSDLEELLIQVSVYAGFPSALTAAGVLRSALEAPDHPDSSAPVSPPSNRAERFRRGAEALSATSAGSGADVVDTFKDVAPDLGRILVEHCYGDVFSRPGLAPKTRELAACSALAAMGTVTSEKPLAVHIDAALNVGADQTEIVETILNTLPYAGYPAVEKALLIAAERFAAAPAAKKLA